MKQLTFNDAALLYCILGEQDADGSVTYPSVEEAISYMLPKKKSKKENITNENDDEQLLLNL